MHEKGNDTEREKAFLERSKTIRFLGVLLSFLCIASIIPELFVSRSGYFGIDGMFGFYAILGFISCVVLVLLGKLCGLILKRREDYYQE